jgi:predicted TPR repeat methyltransferase
LALQWTFRLGYDAEFPFSGIAKLMREALNPANKVVTASDDRIGSLSGEIALHKRDDARPQAQKPAMMALQAKFYQGMALHQQGKLADAERIYGEVLRQQPNNFDALHLLGVIALQTRRMERAVELIRKAIKLNAKVAAAHNNLGCALQDLKRPDDALMSCDKAIALQPNLAEAHNNRGNALKDLKRLADALVSYDKAITLKPDYAEAYYNRGNALLNLKRPADALVSYDKAIALKPHYAEAHSNRGKALMDLKRPEEALASYDKAIALKPDLADAWHARGESLVKLKRVQESIIAYRQALKLGGDFELIKYNLAALGDEPPPIASPARYITGLFDSYADNFDRELTENLKYQTPTLLANAIKRMVSSNALDILDLGCGTGLMGARLRPFGRTLTGVDLSSNMLEKARQREIYDHLICSELINFLHTQDKSFDLAVAADVFIYIGDLSVVFREVRRALRDSGLFCFSVEATDERNFVLRSTKRYAHSIDYLQKLAGQYRFVVNTIEPQIIRREFRGNVNGYHAIMRCC